MSYSASSKEIANVTNPDQSGKVPRNDVLLEGLRFEANKTRVCKCFTGNPNNYRDLVAENRVLACGRQV